LFTIASFWTIGRQQSAFGFLLIYFGGLFLFRV